MITLIMMGLASHATRGEDAAKGPRNDRVGDSLPPGALFRLGTSRFRQEGEVSKLAYSHDGSRMASISRNSVIIWDAQSGRQLRRLSIDSDDAAFQSRFTGLDFSPDGEEIAASTPSHISIWEVDTGLELVTFPMKLEGFFGGEDSELKYSPDGTRLAVAGVGVTVLIYDTSTCERIQTLSDAAGRTGFSNVCWHPDGKRLSVGAITPVALTWDVESGKIVNEFNVKDKAQKFSHCLNYIENGKTLIGARGNTIHFWDAETGKPVKDITVDAKYLVNVFVSPDLQTLVCCSQYGKIHIVDLNDTSKRRQIDARLWITREVAVTPDFRTISVGAVYPTIRQWTIESGEERVPALTSFGHDAPVHCVTYSPDGQLIASGGPNHQIHLWDAKTGTLKQSLSSESSADCLAFHPNGKRLVTSWGNTGSLRIWDVESGNNLRTIETGMKRVREFALSPDGDELIVVTSDSRSSWHSPIGEETLQFRNLKTGELTRSYDFATASTESLVVHPQGHLLFTGAANGVIHVFETKTGKEKTRLVGHEHTADSLTLTDDGSLLASASTDQTIRIWDTATWTAKRILRGHKRAVTSIVFSANGRLLASAGGKKSYPLNPSETHRIRIWNIDTGEQVAEFSGHETNTSSLSFSPDGRNIVSGHDNTTLLIWNVQP